MLLKSEWLFSRIGAELKKIVKGSGQSGKIVSDRLKDLSAETDVEEVDVAMFSAHILLTLVDDENGIADPNLVPGALQAVLSALKDVLKTRPMSEDLIRLKGILLPDPSSELYGDKAMRLAETGTWLYQFMPADPY